MLPWTTDRAADHGPSPFSASHCQRSSTNPERISTASQVITVKSPYSFLTDATGRPYRGISFTLLYVRPRVDGRCDMPAAKIRRFKPKRSHQDVELPATFVPGFWKEQDHRTAAVQEIRRRYQLLRDDACVDSFQKDLICQRATFLSLRLETQEVEYAKTGQIDTGVYTQQLNSLLGLLKALGLEKKVRRVGLKTYLGNGDGEGQT